MFSSVWHDYLYLPLLNLLIFLYNTGAYGNLGVAVIYLTVILRVVLIPLSVISERNSAKYENIAGELKAANQYLKDDPIARKERVRELLKEQRINPWASVVLLGIQLIVLVLLYQVFVAGMNAHQFQALYSFIVKPDLVNTKFLGINIAKANLWSSLLVAGLLYIQIYRGQRKRKDFLERGDILFRIAFPLFTFIILYQLPAVKAIFILTSMGFSYIVHLFRPLIVPRLKAAIKGKSGKK